MYHHQIIVVIAILPIARQRCRMIINHEHAGQHNMKIRTMLMIGQIIVMDLGK